MVVHTWNPRTQEAEAGGSLQIQGQHELQRETMPLNKYSGVFPLCFLGGAVLLIFFGNIEKIHTHVRAHTHTPLPYTHILY